MIHLIITKPEDPAFEYRRDAVSLVIEGKRATMVSPDGETVSYALTDEGDFGPYVIAIGETS